MKRWILLIVVVVGLSAAGTVAVQILPGLGAKPTDLPISASASSTKSGFLPKAVLVGENIYEFGTLPQRTTGKHAFTVKNEGKGDLELWMISSTCSCTLATFKDGKKAVVKPGESTDIVLEFETRENSGDYSKGAEIGSNDPGLASFSLAVKGKVYPAIVTFPPDSVVNLATLSNDEDDHISHLAVMSFDRPETKVISVKSSNPNIVVTSAPMKPEDLKMIPQEAQVKNASLLTINIKGTMPLGFFREELVITTDHPKQPEARRTLSGKMIGPVNAVPSTVVMHEVYSKAGATNESMVVVRENRPTKFKIVKVPDKIQAEIVPAGDGSKPGRYKLVVTVPPGTPATRIEDEIKIETDHPKAATFSVPVSIWILNAN
ncbi:MAG: DUF1573 domain-containing protein [Isosphaeraceae bacterium]